MAHTYGNCTEDRSAELLACFPLTAFKIDDEPAYEYSAVLLHPGRKLSGKSFQLVSELLKGKAPKVL